MAIDAIGGSHMRIESTGLRPIPRGLDVALTAAVQPSNHDLPGFAIGFDNALGTSVGIRVTVGTCDHQVLAMGERCVVQPTRFDVHSLYKIGVGFRGERVAFPAGIRDVGCEDRCPIPSVLDQLRDLGWKSRLIRQQFLGIINRDRLQPLL